MSDVIELPRHWVFERTPRMGGATGEAFANTLNSTGMPRSAVLAREAVQNSVDAKDDETAKVRVVFRTVQLRGADKTSFEEAANLIRIGDRKGALCLSEPNGLTALGNPEPSLNLLYVDDFFTTGLSGDPSDPSSKFYRFFLSIGDGGKVHEERGTGGSYGFGKSVYCSNSAVQTIFAYSRTRGANGNPVSRLFGAGYFKAHEHNGTRYTGRSWFGVESLENGQVAVSPVEGDEADQRAADLGFTPRDESEFGTSVLIVDASVEAADILAGVEDWWWPRLASDGLDVEIHPHGEGPLIPRPRARTHLRPFVEAFDVATGKSPAKPGREKAISYNKNEGLGVGVCGLRVLERTEDDELPVAEERVDSVALIRLPRMVVSYHRKWSPGLPPTVGVFVADNDIDDILRASENAAHDIWDVDSQRLRDPTGRKKRVVNGVLSKIRKSIKDFQKAASPPPPPRPRHLTVMERALASFLNPSRGGGQPDRDVSSAPIHLTYEGEPVPVPNSDGHLILEARYAVRLKDEFDQDSLDVRLEAKCFVMADGAEEDELPLETSSEAGSLTPSGNGYAIRLEKGTSIRLRSVSGPYDPAWTVRFVPTVTAGERGE